MNSWNGVGRLTRQPELKYSPSGTAVARFTVAINRRFKKEETDFINCVAFKQAAEYIANYGDKGRLVSVEGELQIDKYETKDGQKREKAEIMVSNVSLLDKAAANKTAEKPDVGWDDLGK